MNEGCEAVYFVRGNRFYVAVKHPPYFLRKTLRLYGVGRFNWQKGIWMGVMSKDSFTRLVEDFRWLKFKPYEAGELRLREWNSLK